MLRPGVVTLLHFTTANTDCPCFCDYYSNEWLQMQLFVRFYLFLSVCARTVWSMVVFCSNRWDQINRVVWWMPCPDTTVNTMHCRKKKKRWHMLDGAKSLKHLMDDRITNMNQLIFYTWTNIWARYILVNLNQIFDTHTQHCVIGKMYGYWT